MAAGREWGRKEREERGSARPAATCYLSLGRPVTRRVGPRHSADARNVALPRLADPPRPIMSRPKVWFSRPLRVAPSARGVASFVRRSKFRSKRHATTSFHFPCVCVTCAIGKSPARRQTSAHFPRLTITARPRAQLASGAAGCHGATGTRRTMEPEGRVVGGIDGNVLPSSFSLVI